MTGIPPAARVVPSLVWRQSGTAHGERHVPEETAIAFSYNRVSHAVMMATPDDLEDFALGFSLAERIVERAEEIEELEIVTAAQGMELRMWIPPERMTALETHRRHIAGPTGCGLCGLESLAEAMRPPASVDAKLRIAPTQLMQAMQAIGPLQTLNEETRAVHAAAFWTPARGVALLREDVGRHNALDKLAGGMARAGIAATEGAVLLTSRISVELVQKAARMGASILVAVSAPTALAIRMAEEAGMTLVGVARRDGFEVFAHTRRIVLESVPDAAH
jgi:FdhD protein